MSSDAETNLKPKTRIRKWTKDAKLPQRASTGAAGLDLFAARDAVVPAHGKELVPAGFAISLRRDRYLRIAPRSSLAWKQDVETGAGVVDSDFRGQVHVLLRNFGDEPVKIEKDQSIANGIITKIDVDEVEYYDESHELDQTERGEKGYGSTDGKVLEEPKLVDTTTASS